MGRVGYTRNAPRPNIGILAEYTVNFDRVSRNRRVAKGGISTDRPPIRANLFLGHNRGYDRHNSWPILARTRIG